MINNNKKGGKNSRIGLKLFNEIERIKDNRLKIGTSKDRISTEKLTNMLVRHKLFSIIALDIINSPEEEINKYGI